MRGQGGVAAFAVSGGVGVLVALAAWGWFPAAAAAGDTVLSTTAPAIAVGTRTAPVDRPRDAGDMPPLPAAPPFQPSITGSSMPVYVGPEGVVAVPSIDMTPNSGVVYAPPPPRSAITDDKKR